MHFNGHLLKQKCLQRALKSIHLILNACTNYVINIIITCIIIIIINEYYLGAVKSKNC